MPRCKTTGRNGHQPTVINRCACDFIRFTECHELKRLVLFICDGGGRSVFSKPREKNLKGGAEKLG